MVIVLLENFGIHNIIELHDMSSSFDFSSVNIMLQQF
jgi:hypothetical protein